MKPVARTPEPHIIRATTLAAAGEEALERVAKALRGARARTGLSEGHIVALLTARGIASTSLCCAAPSARA